MFIPSASNAIHIEYKKRGAKCPPVISEVIIVF